MLVDLTVNSDTFLERVSTFMKKEVWFLLYSSSLILYAIERNRNWCDNIDKVS